MTWAPAPLVAVELDRDEREDLEEGELCSSGLMCLALRIGNYPAPVSWHLEADPLSGHDRARDAYAWRFDGDPLGGLYCEDCTVEIERIENEGR